MFNQAIKLAADNGKLEAMLSQAQRYSKALEEDVRTMTEKTQELEESLVSRRVRGARCVRGSVHATPPPCLMPLRPP